MIRRLGPGDEAVLAALARDDAAFDLEEPGRARDGVSGSAAAAYLSDPHVLHFVAEEDDALLGHLLCYVERRRAGNAFQVLLYEIGVREGHRRRGIGGALMKELDAWMAEHGVATVWVLADNEGAEAFYAACGFARDELQAVHMSRSR